MISVYGSTGYIGSRFYMQHLGYTCKVPRVTRESPTRNILYFISTIHNYNIYSNPHLDIETNLSVLIETLEANRKKYGSDFVFNFVSSWFVYGKTNEYPAKETSQCNPTGFYSITKRAAEQLLISYCQTFGIKYRILRLCNVISECASFSKQKNALQQMIYQLAVGQKVKLYDGGSNVRDFMHVNDVCTALKVVLDKGQTNEIYNIGSGEPRRIGELIRIARETMSLPESKIESIEAPEFHKTVQIKNMYLDNSKIKNLGFVKKYKIEDVVRDIATSYWNIGPMGFLEHKNMKSAFINPRIQI